MSKRIITVKNEQIAPYEFEGKLSDVRDRIALLMAKYGPDARLDFDRNFYYDYDPNPSPTFFLYGDREETDQEYKKRVDDEKERQRLIEVQERAMFEGLQKKYGK